MKYRDIEQRFTDVVAGYLSQGYTIDTRSMCTIWGDVTAIVDLVKDRDLVRVKLRDDREKAKGRYASTYVKFVELSVEGIEVLLEEKYYAITPDRKIVLYGTKGEAVKAFDLRFLRATRKIRFDKLEDRSFENQKSMELAKRFVRRKLGLKRVHSANLGVLKNNGEYQIWYGEKYWALH